MKPETIRSDWAGQVIDGRFPLLQWLGGSESAGVFLTELPGDPSRKAVIKLIPADAVNAEALISGWAVITPLSHPHLMRLFHSGRCQIGALPLLYAVTEYAQEILSQILPQRPLTPTETGEMLDSVLDALSYLHGRGFVHGRLKPSNIMAVDDQLKLSCDILYLAGEPGKLLPAPGVYDAPEGATAAISPAADIWSLGVSLVEALTQHPPAWDRSTQTEPIVPNSIPHPFAGIARESLRSDPERRCTLSDVKARLEPARPLSAFAGRISRTIPAKLRRPALVAAALIVIAVIAVSRLQSDKTQPTPPTGEQQSGPAIAILPPQSPVPPEHNSRRAAVNDAIVEQVLPDVLPGASASIHGQISVKIRVAVDPAGHVSDAAFDSPGPSKYFAKAALQAAQRWRFKPAQVDSRAVSSVWILQFKFTQTATEVTPVEVSP